VTGVNKTGSRCCWWCSGPTCVTWQKRIESACVPALSDLHTHTHTHWIDTSREPEIKTSFESRISKRGRWWPCHPLQSITCFAYLHRHQIEAWVLRCFYQQRRRRNRAFWSESEKLIGSFARSRGDYVSPGHLKSYENIKIIKILSTEKINIIFILMIDFECVVRLLMLWSKTLDGGDDVNKWCSNSIWLLHRLNNHITSLNHITPIVEITIGWCTGCRLLNWYYEWWYLRNRIDTLE
jgi:hypothetical protein